MGRIMSICLTPGAQRRAQRDRCSGVLERFVVTYRRLPAQTSALGFKHVPKTGDKTSHRVLVPLEPPAGAAIADVNPKACLVTMPIQLKPPAGRATAGPELVV